MRSEFGTHILQGVIVPCGKCETCKKNRAHEWAVRLEQELEYHQSATFITLTYNDQNVPVSDSGLLTLRKTDLQKFFKRFRKNTKTKIKYYACGEYGSKTQRPHYHAIIFGWQPEPTELLEVTKKTYSCKVLEDIWSFGNVQVGSVTSQSIHYVSGYIIKSINKKEVGDRQREFLLSSQGLGLQYAVQYQADMEDGTMDYNGEKVPIPKYYRKKIYVDKSKIDEQMIKKELRVKHQLIEKYQIEERNILEVQEKARKHRKQQHRELVKKLENKLDKPVSPGL